MGQKFIKENSNKSKMEHERNKKKCPIKPK